ncbi:pyrroline-5-carboxylate reductase [Elusimicrobiota bacterium]
MKKKITFIGAGNMAEALISGFVRKGLIKRQNIIATDISTKKLQLIKKKYKIKIEKDIIKAVKNSEVVVLCVKPQQMKIALGEVLSAVRQSQLIVSIAAGITTSFIEKVLNKRISVVRVMPNSPALLGAGAIAVCGGKYAKNSQVDYIIKLFQSLGKVVKLAEKNMNAVTALSGSGPAYIFYLAEAMEKAGASIGLTKEAARILVSQTIYGAGKMLINTKKSSSQLRLDVTSLGGTTEAAIKYMASKEFFDIIKNTLKEAQSRAEEIGK